MPSSEFFIHRYRIFVEWPHRFSRHPTHHGLNGTPKIVARPEFKAARWPPLQTSTMTAGWNYWLYLPSRTYTASFAYGRKVKS